MATPDPPIQLGRFELDRIIAESASATVWRGHHRRSQTPVAVKMVDPETLVQFGGLQGFRRSVQAQARLTHPGIAQVFDYGTVEAEVVGKSEEWIAEGAPYLVMEYADHGTLASALLPQDFEWCREILMGILWSLAHAHARYVIHRDLKPANVLRFPDRSGCARWKLTDFGFALQMRDLDLDTSPGVAATAGTPHYMAPEQLEGDWRRFGPWTDLYQVGCIAYELVCGSVPYPGQTFGEIAAGHLYQDPPSLEPRFEVPDGLEAWIHRLMARSPTDAYRLAADAARRLGELRLPETTGSSDQVGAELIEEKRPTSVLEPPLAEVAPGEASAVPGWQLTTPFPDSVRRLPQTTDAARFSDVGLSLFGLRERRLADREAAYDQLWTALESVVASGEPRSVVVDAPSGLGKTQLVEAFARRVDELGIATVLGAIHDRGGGRGEGLAGLVERWVQGRGADRAEWAELLEFRFQLVGPDEGQPADTSDLVAQLTELIATPADREAGGASVTSSDERFAAVEQLMERLAAERPVVVVFDDLHLGPESAAFLEWLLDTYDAPPVLVAATSTPEAPIDSESTGRRLERIRAHDRTDHVELGPLAPPDQYDLVDALLPLDRDVVEHVVERSEGHPLFAVQLVQEWVDRDHLAHTESGFRFAGESPPAIADSLVDLWIQRVEETLDGGERDRAADMEALEVAAVLGRRFDGAELRHALEVDGLDYPEGLLERRLVDRGLLERELDGWRFCHRLLVESLEEHARRSGRLTDHHRRCAEAIAAQGQTLSAADADRRARHLRASDQTEAALAPLLEAARYYRRQAGLFDRAHELLERRRRWLDDCDVPETDPRRLANQIEHAWTYLHRGESHTARRLAERTRSIAESEGRTDMAAEAHMLMARIDHDQGDLEEASSHVRSAEEAFRHIDDAAGMTRCLRFRAQLARRRQQPEDARVLFETVRDRYEEAGDPVGRAWSDWGIAWTWLDQREVDRAQRVADALIEEAESLDAPRLLGAVHNLLGEITRLRDDWEAAITHYESARDTWRRSGAKDHLVAELNLALAEIGAERWRDAATTLRSLQYQLEAAGWKRFRVHLALGLAACAAHAGDWETVDQRIAEARSALEDTEALDPDAAELAATAADLCREADEDERAERLAAL